MFLALFILFGLLSSLVDSFSTTKSVSALHLKPFYKSIWKSPRLETLQLSNNKINKVVAESSAVNNYESDLKKFLGWFGATMGFAAIVSSIKGSSSGIEFLSGYFLEQTLSIDNLFVFLLLFKFFSIEKKNEERILAYGIYGGLRLNIFKYYMFCIM